MGKPNQTDQKGYKKRGSKKNGNAVVKGQRGAAIKRRGNSRLNRGGKAARSAARKGHR